MNYSLVIGALHLICTCSALLLYSDLHPLWCLLLAIASLNLYCMDLPYYVDLYFIPASKERVGVLTETCYNTMVMPLDIDRNNHM
jgi:hypothetical protein